MPQRLEAWDNDRPEINVEYTKQEQNMKYDGKKNQRFHVLAVVSYAIKETPKNLNISSVEIPGFVNPQDIHALIA